LDVGYGNETNNIALKAIEPPVYIDRNLSGSIGSPELSGSIVESSLSGSIKEISLSGFYITN
jgi:hypothetical protein